MVVTKGVPGTNSGKGSGHLNCIAGMLTHTYSLLCGGGGGGREPSGNVRMFFSRSEKTGENVFFLDKLLHCVYILILI